jgi:anti-sigma B factor antagonist
MSLVCESRRIGDITVVTCRGSIVEGHESMALQREVTELLSHTVYIVVDLGGVAFIDSSGIGLLVRLLNNARRAGGDLKLCALSERVTAVLSVTRLAPIFDIHDTHADAIAACYGQTQSAATSLSLETDLLCVHDSPDVLAYVRALVTRAGFGVLTALNLSDARMLTKATQPKALIMSSALHAQAIASGWADADGPPVIELSREFATDEAGHAAQILLDQVRAAMAARF